MLITYLFILGIFFLMLENRRKFLLIFIYICLHLIFILFLFSPYISRYLLPVWPFILLLCGYALFNIASQLSKKTSIPTVMIGIFLTLIIIINGHKFVFKPKSFYSVNHDFREIALIDYNSIYSIIKQKGHLDDGKTAVIDTWHDRIYWYLGSHYSATYLFRWQNDKDTTNGLLRKTFFVYNNNGEKILPRQKDLRFIGELKDLKIAMQKYARGFIFIDDNTMPKDVIHYVETHFKKELYLDHYPSDDNPYSIWPATLYSWGI